MRIHGLFLNFSFALTASYDSMGLFLVFLQIGLWQWFLAIGAQDDEPLAVQRVQGESRLGQVLLAARTTNQSGACQVIV